jgi:hypothetical protein
MIIETKDKKFKLIYIKRIILNDVIKSLKIYISIIFYMGLYLVRNKYWRLPFNLKSFMD